MVIFSELVNGKNLFDGSMATVNFYLNEGDYNRVKDLEQIEEFTLHHPQLVWSWGTYFRLKQRGYDVTLCHKIPNDGILVMPAIYLALLQKPPANVLLICTVADSPPPLYMQVNVTQNPGQPSHYPNVFGLPIWRHIPHWPQPGLIPRNAVRGRIFENIAFFGHTDQLESSLRTETFRERLKQLGLNFEVRENDFTDYSSVDAVVAIRDFSNNVYVYKPYTKLINGWIAGTPVIVGPESSFQLIRKSEHDFLLAKNREELEQALFRLKNDESLRTKMIQNGYDRLKEFDEEAVAQAWANLLFKDAPMYYSQWKKKGTLSKQLFYADLFLSRSLRSVKNKLLQQIQFG